MELGLSKHVALITGGASGIGAAVARQFAREGASIAIWDLSKDVAGVANEIESQFQVPALGVMADITDRDSISRALAVVTERFSVVDHLVHSAAIGSGKFGFPFTNLTPQDWLKTVDVNIMGMVNVAHALAPLMVSRKQGTLTFVSSVAGQIGSQTDPPYSAAKAANINFAQCMAKDLAQHGIRVNTVCPGMVQTPLNKGVWQAWYNQQTPEKRRSYEEWAGDKVRNVIPLGTWQTPEDVADMIVFLSSKRAAQVTGQTINVDGGFVMHW